MALVAVLMVSSLLNVAYLLPIPIRAFFAKPDPEPEGGHGGDHGHGHSHDGIHEAPMFCVVPLCLTAFGCLVMFFFPGPVHELLDMLMDNLRVGAHVNPFF